MSRHSKLETHHQVHELDPKSGKRVTKIINTDESHSEELGKLSESQEKLFTPGSSQRSSIDSVGFVGSDKDSYPTNSPPTSEGSNHATEQKSEGSDRSTPDLSAISAFRSVAIHLIADEDYTFSLYPYHDVLDSIYHKHYDEYVCNLRIDEAGNLFRSSLNPVKPDTFIPLGWLVESTPKTHRTTRHACLWNTSTEPHSIWLVYDYYGQDPGGVERFDPNLDTRAYYNFSAYDQALDKIIGKDKSSPKIPQASTKPSSTYLNVHIFDIGMIVQDVNTWDPAKGVAGDQAKDSLRETGRLIGSELQAANISEGTDTKDS